MVENITPDKPTKRQQIYAVLGKRMSGKTTSAEILHNLIPNSTLITMQAYALQAFIELHSISLEEFLRPNNFKQNRALLGAFIDHARSKDRNIFITPVLTYIQNCSVVILEDIYYFNELDVLIKLGAKLIWIECEDKQRLERYINKFPVNDPLEAEVASLEVDLINRWPNLHIVKNNDNIGTLRMALRDVVYK